MGKILFIADKNLRTAVVEACSHVKETGHFNEAVRMFAERYDVREEEVAKYIRIAQSNGQREANKKTKRKYYWFAVEYYKKYAPLDFDDFDDRTVDTKELRWEVRRGLSEESVKRALGKIDYVRYTHEYCTIVRCVKKFRSKKEAEECVDKMMDEARERFDNEIERLDQQRVSSEMLDKFFKNWK